MRSNTYQMLLYGPALFFCSWIEEEVGALIQAL
jgi:hypothetical protein